MAESEAEQEAELASSNFEPETLVQTRPKRSLAE